jgi:hypothetical protein
VAAAASSSSSSTSAMHTAAFLILHHNLEVCVCVYIYMRACTRRVENL